MYRYYIKLVALGRVMAWRVHRSGNPTEILWLQCNSMHFLCNSYAYLRQYPSHSPIGRHTFCLTPVSSRAVLSPPSSFLVRFWLTHPLPALRSNTTLLLVIYYSFPYDRG